ncbi:F-box protein SKIP16-like [Panicum virgatum]|uniref:F-box protein SKIP16-like n=1 Tax=Panicum virgatum TaxID=38727 RepID=UPI0019D558A8|nr:F-box protein SKIP16-like [Panicum virgatum]
MQSPAKRRPRLGHATPSALENLPPVALARVIARAGPRGAASLACASKTLRAAASSEERWRRFCADDIGIDAPVDPEGRVLPSFKATYVSWLRSFRMYPLPLVKRVKMFWTMLKSWLSEFFPGALETFAEGLSDTDIRIAEYELGFQLPMPTKLLYRFCNGQLWRNDLQSCGIIGGYEFYYHEMINVHLLPLKHAVERAKSNYIVVADTSFEEKTFLLDCLSGQLYVVTKNFKSNGEMMPCVPNSLIRLHTDNNHMPQDGLLLWLEEHLRKLQSGLIKVQISNFRRDARHISLYPETPPTCSIAVTHGIKVRASAVFVPEDSSVYGDPCKYVYYYFIRVSLPDACNVDGKCYSSCQFQSCSLTIRTGNCLS